MSINSNDRALTDAKLAEMLAGAVPIYLNELKAMHPLERGGRARSWCTDATREVIAKGPQLKSRTRERGATARVFNLLARGLAAISLQPDGIMVFGRIWCARHHPTGRILEPIERDRERGCGYCVTGQKMYEQLPPRQDFRDALRALGDAL